MQSSSSLSPRSEGTTKDRIPNKKVPKQLLQSFKNTAHLPLPPNKIHSPSNSQRTRRLPAPLPSPREQKKIVNQMRKRGMIPPPIFLPVDEAQKAIEDLKKLGIPYPHPNQWKQVFGVTPPREVTKLLEIDEESIIQGDIARVNGNQSVDNSLTDQSIIHSLLTKDDQLEFYERDEEHSPQRINMNTGSLRSIAESIKRVQTHQIMEVPQHEEQALSSRQAEQNDQMKSTHEEKHESSGVPELKLLRNYDRPAISSRQPVNHSYQHPRTTSRRNHYTSPLYSSPSSTASNRTSTRCYINQSVQVQNAQAAIASSRQWILRRHIY